ncbi:Type IV pilus biogenesis and competence protein PilQ [Pseudidiomarina piscicola]|uniref:Type IV pilus biogenesis and competence protein PilQ n=1 Tax=Pseudidiomarina piscicola TaxID=2614830 RepID=A0A6S6WN23_9GAMM|nr:type IV pilus secretin PilQ family protein [Pseudidiomarina piscicola]CAB0151449.1 Type IV pilus biogenesis and competence protein PilQ [Pseudidiomarina piscicola]VZT40928.1 Type IV pilus biogenesis and competence protein PilQ [Pseudomonas aeruginosa]
MTYFFRFIMLVMLLPAMAAANELVRIEQIPLANDRFNLEVHFTDAVKAPVVRRSENPLVHEFLLLGTANELASGLQSLADHPLLEDVSLEQQREDTLLRVTTKQPLDHLLSRYEDVMVLVFVESDEPATQTASTASVPPASPATATEVEESVPAPVMPTEPAVTTSAATTSSDLPSVTDIDFTRLPDDVALLRLQLSDDGIEHEARVRGNRLELTLYDTEITDDLLYVLDVSQFATPIAHIETFREGDDAVVTITGKGDFRHQLEQIDGSLNLKFSKPIEVVENDGSQRPISLNFQNVPVRQLLQILANENDLNLVASESVSGNITLRLENVPWQRALNTILRVKGLSSRMDSNILIVAPADELAEREEQELEAKQRLSQLAPLESTYIQINYAKAVDIATILRTESSDLLSQRGAVTVDERTNTLLVRDTPRQIEEVEAMVKVLDVAVKQVVIEARMVTVRDNISDEIGINWGITNPNVDAPNFLGSGTTTGADLNVNLPVTSPAATIGFQVAKLADGRLLDLELSALERENKGEVIASPRITTANQKKAYIEQGTEIPYVESASSGATSVQFKKAVLGLEVTPQITPDNRVIMDLVITQNTRGETVTTPTGPAVSIDTQEIGTQVLVENGETIVLGGIYQQQILNDITKVPVLGDIPYVGVLFRSDSQIHEKRELLIFVTPRIVMSTP